MTKLKIIKLLVGSVALILALVFIFYKIWIIYICGPGFTEKIIAKSGEQSKNVAKNIKLTFLTTGHIKRLFSSELMLSELFLNSIEKINILNPDLVFITGDLIAMESYNPYNESKRNGEKEKKLFEYCWKQLDKDLRKINAKVVIAPGNHEVYNINGRQAYKERAGDFFYSFTEQDVRFVILNSSRMEENYPESPKGWTIPEKITHEQLEFLSSGFSKHWKEENIFIFVHHSPWSIPNWNKDVEPILHKTNCKVVFSGTQFGTLKHKLIDDVHYIDGGFDCRGLVPNYFAVTKIFKNNTVKLESYPILPENLYSHIRMIYHFFKVRITKYAKLIF